MEDRIATEIRTELEASRSEFHKLLAAVSSEHWRHRSLNPGWTNGQLLFHIALGFFLLVPLVYVMRIFAALPPIASKLFAKALNVSTPLFNRINAIGPRLGARLVNQRRLGSLFDSVCRRILRKVESIRPGEWTRGMHYPVRWEPRFADFMTMESLFHYPTIHLRHHRRQIAAGVIPSEVEGSGGAGGSTPPPRSVRRLRGSG